MDKVEQISLEILNTSLLEWLAVLSSLFYVVLIARKHILGWFFAAISSGIYSYLCFINNYYLETILQVFYLAMAFWGWFHWHTTRNEKQFIRRWKLNHHLFNILISAGLTVLLGFLFDTYTNQLMPYLDAFTTVFSIAATFMVASKVLENWLYWIVIDIASIQLYGSRDLNLTAVLYFLYAVIALIGFIRWRRVYLLQGK